MSMFTKTDKAPEGQKSPQAKEGQAMEREAAQEPGYTPQGRQRTESTIASIIGPGLTVTGNLESDGDIQIEGTVEGDVRSQGVTVGQGATVKGSVYADAVQVAGTLEGKIEAKSVTISKSGHMIGDLIHESLEVQAGAYLDGHCRRKQGTVTAFKPSSSPPKDSPSSEPVGSSGKPDSKGQGRS